MTPRELVDQALHLLLDKDMAGFAALWTPDGVMEFPFAPPGYPRRLDGRAAIAEYLRGYPDILDIHEISEVRVHQSLDPDVVVVEFRAAGIAVATGQPYQLDYIAVITVRDNAIAHYRDYWDPVAAVTAIGGLDRLIDAFTGWSR